MESEPFLLYPSSKAYLDGDPRGLQERFRIRRDALDFLAMAGIVGGSLLLLVHVLQLAQGAGPTDASVSAATFGVAALVIGGGAYYLLSRRSAAAAQARLVREGRVLPGTLTACTSRVETTAEASLGEVPRSYLVTVEYRFTSPTGQDIADQAEHNRPDLRRVDLPEAGAGVRVLYLDDQTYALL